jgi:peptidoglycan/LPS O-acetylase OafA/YrhL
MRIRELDGLRGIAVLAVLAHHYLLWVPWCGAQFGWLGVDLFFVLSGFLITSILVDMRGKPRFFSTFYSRRAFRIFPPYFVVIAVYLTISCIVGKSGSYGLWAQYIFYYTSLIPGIPPDKTGNALIPFVAMGLQVMWSLSVEEIYYTIWAPIVRFTSHRIFASILIFMIVAAPLVRLVLHAPFGPERYIFYGRMDGLAYGSVIALVVHQRRRFPEKWQPWDRILNRGTIFFGLFTLLFWTVTRGNVNTRLVSTLGISLADMSFAVVVFAIIRHAGGGDWWLRVLRSKVLRSFGMISYTLYLVNYPLHNLANTLVTRLHLSAHASAVLVVVAGIGLSCGFSYAMWYGLESKALRWKDRLFPSSHSPELSLAKR